MIISRTDLLLDFVQSRGLVRAREVKAAGFHTAILYRLRDRGQLEQVGPGLFRHPESEISESYSYAEAAKLVPSGVICLLSALAFHGIGTQNPRQIWMALERGRKPPRNLPVPMTFTWYSISALHEGVESHQVGGVPVRVFGPAKTIVDLFKFRNKVGIDVAVEALRAGWEDRRFTTSELMRYAETCRVQKIIRPYLQAIA